VTTPGARAVAGDQRDQYEPNRFLGFPVTRNPRVPRQGEESQRVMGFPVDWFSGVDLDWLDSLAHPIRSYQRWLRRRRLGPYATGDDEPTPRR
jgi:hypothetical protein